MSRPGAAGVRIGIDWETSLFSLEQFRMGMDVELEHGTRDPATNVTDDDVLMTAKIARAHLNEFPDYYTRLVLQSLFHVECLSAAGCVTAMAAADVTVGDDGGRGDRRATRGGRGSFPCLCRHKAIPRPHRPA